MQINPVGYSPSFKKIHTYSLSLKQSILMEEAKKDPVIKTLTKGFEEHDVDFDFVGDDEFISAKITNPTTINERPLGKMKAKVRDLNEAKLFIAKVYAAALTYMMDHDDNIDAGTWYPASF